MAKIPFHGRKCRHCQRAIKTAEEQKLTVYAGQTYHAACFEHWVNKRIERINKRIVRGVATNEEIAELKDLHDLIK